MKFLLGTFSNVNAKNVDYQVRLDLRNHVMMYDEDTLYKIIDENKQFQAERNACTNYLIYGKVESFIDSFLNFDSYKLNDTNYDIELGYISHLIPDNSSLIAFTLLSGTTINVANASSLMPNDVVLVYKDKDTFYYSKILDISGTVVVLDLDPTVNIVGYFLVPAVARYTRIFKQLYSNNYIKYYKSSFATNIYGDEITQYHTYKNINNSGITNNLDLPLTEFVFRYKKKNESFVMYKKTGKTQVIDNDIIDFVTYDLNQMEITVNDTVIHKFVKQVPSTTGGIIPTEFYYEPYSLRTTRVFSNTVTTGNEISMFSYPDHAILFYSGDIRYKNYLDVGYFEEGTNGIDYPFMNNLNYLYDDAKFIIRRTIGIATYPKTSDSTSSDYNDTAVGDIPVNGVRLC